MQYQEFQPHPTLRRYIKSYWLVEIPSTLQWSQPRQFITDGGMELIFNLEHQLRYHFQSPPLQQVPSTLHMPLQIKRGCLLGGFSRDLHLCTTGSATFFGVRFYPGGSFPFVRIPAHRLKDRVIDIDAFWGSSGHALAQKVGDAGDDNLLKVSAVEDALFELLANHKKDDRKMEHAVRIIENRSGKIGIDQLAHHLELSGRQLERKFLEKVGFTPKQLCRIVRFRSVFRHMLLNPGDSWAAIAFACGYFDQSHLIRDFKYFTRRSPSAFFAQFEGMEDSLSLLAV